jgi:type IV pilus assembly protein PilM
MAKYNDSWGIEVGANAIKAMRLVRGSNDEAQLAEYDVLPFDQILTSPDVDVEASVRQKLDLFLQRHDVSESELVVSVPGHMAFARFAKLPPVEAKKVPDVVKFEAQQQIPFPIEQVEWDYQVFEQGADNQLGVGIFAMNKERIGQVLSYYHQFDLELNALTLSPLAVYNAFQYDNANQQQTEGTMYMDIGAVSTDVIIVENGGIWLRTLPIGGNHFTEALVRAFKLSYPKAEKLKREAGTSKYARQIFQAMRPVFADLVQEVQRSLGYYQSLHRESNLTRLVGVGSTFRLPGLRKFLKQQLQMEVERPSGFNRIQAEGPEASEFADHAMNMATAYGLALQGLGMETVTANLLPEHTLQARMWQSKQPWFAAAGACMLLAALVAGGSYLFFSFSWDDLRGQTDQLVEAALERSRQVEDQWGEQDIETPRTEINNLARLWDYGDLWPGFISDVSAAKQAVDSATDTDGELTEAYITQVASVYKPAPNASDEDQQGSAGPGAGGPPRPGGYPGGAGRMAGVRTPEEISELGKAVDIEDFFGEDGDGPPQITITVRGTTAMSNANNQLSEHFNSALRNRPAQENRPYRTVRVSVASMSQPYEPGPSRGRGKNTRGEEGGDQPGGIPRGGIPRSGIPRPGEGQMPPGRGSGGDSPDSGDVDRRYSSNVGELEQYLPDAPPYGGAEQVRDFRIEWVVALRRPEAARGIAPDTGQDTPEAAQRSESDETARADGAEEASS